MWTFSMVILLRCTQVYALQHFSPLLPIPHKLSTNSSPYASKTESKAKRLETTLPALCDKTTLLYIDDNLIVLNKPSGLPTVRGSNNHPHTLMSVARKFHLQNLNLQDDETITTDQMVSHRLDMDTSGCVIFARNLSALRDLHHQFGQRTQNPITKTYIALVANPSLLSPNSTITNNLTRDAMHPPWMTIQTPLSISNNKRAIEEQQGNGKWQKMLTKSQLATTHYEVLSHEVR